MDDDYDNEASVAWSVHWDGECWACFGGLEVMHMVWKLLCAVGGVS